MQGQIASKSLEIIQDLMNAESLACRKCQWYATGFTDQELKTLVTSIAQRHGERFNALNTYLNQH